MTVGGPGGPGAAQAAFENPQNRDELLEMHRAGTPFLEMAAKLKVAISPEHAKLIQDLSDKDVAIIRSAMVAALEANPPRTQMPYDCTLKSIPPSLVVTETGSAAAPQAVITPGN